MTAAILAGNDDTGLVGIFSGGCRRVDRHHDAEQRRRVLTSALVQRIAVPQRAGRILEDLGEKLLPAEAGALAVCRTRVFG